MKTLGRKKITFTSIFSFFYKDFNPFPKMINFDIPLRKAVKNKHRKKNPFTVMFSKYEMQIQCLC